MQENLHIAMVMDGNRRWAVENGKNKLQGHKYGAEKLKEAIQWCSDIKARALTVYAFSTENFKRAEEEVTSLYALMKKYFKDLMESKEIADNEIQINFLGKLSMFPQDLQDLMNEYHEKTKNHSGFKLNFCVAYGGHQELVDAVNKAVEKGEKVTEESFEELLYMQDKPDLVIRTGGAVRMSNFLPWQTAYSELFFLETYWPALTKEMFLDILEQFDVRKRNFGK